MSVSANMQFNGTWSGRSNYQRGALVQYAPAGHNPSLWICIVNNISAPKACDPSNPLPDLPSNSNWRLLGLPSIQFQGVWLPSVGAGGKLYGANDLVFHDGSCYICTFASAGGFLSVKSPDEDSTNWAVFAAEGEKGVMGKLYFKECGEFQLKTLYMAANSPSIQASLVRYGGATWYCTKNTTGCEIPGTHDNWVRIAPKGDKGDRGIDGINGTSFVATGPWDMAKEYVAGQSVSFSDGCSYLAINSSTNVKPTAADHQGVWQLLAARGPADASFASVSQELRVDLTGLQANVVKLQSDTRSIPTLETNVAQLQLSVLPIAGLTTDVNRLRTDLETTTVTLRADLATSTMAVEARVADRVDALDAKAANQVAALADAVSTQVAALDAKMTNQVGALAATTTGQVAALDTKLTGQITTQVAALDSKVTHQMTEQSAAFNSVIQTLDTKVTALGAVASGQVTSLDVKLTGQIASQVTALESRLSERVSTLGSVVTDQTSVLATLGSTVAEQKVTQSATGERVLALETQTSGLGNQLSSLQTTFSTFKATPGPAGAKGDSGMGFTIASKIYKTAAELEASRPSPDEVAEGQFAIVNSASQSDPDYGRLYLWSGGQWTYTVDMSVVAAQGIQGPPGAASTVPGPQGPIGLPGLKGDTGAASTIPGPQGPMGPAGPAGANNWTPSVQDKTTTATVTLADGFLILGSVVTSLFLPQALDGTNTRSIQLRVKGELVRVMAEAGPACSQDAYGNPVSTLSKGYYTLLYDGTDSPATWAFLSNTNGSVDAPISGRVGQLTLRASTGMDVTEELPNAFSFRNALVWSSTSNYAMGDQVVYKGLGYTAKSDLASKNATPDVDRGAWAQAVPVSSSSLQSADAIAPLVGLFATSNGVTQMGNFQMSGSIAKFETPPPTSGLYEMYTNPSTGQVSAVTTQIDFPVYVVGARDNHLRAAPITGTFTVGLVFPEVSAKSRMLYFQAQNQPVNLYTTSTNALVLDTEGNAVKNLPPRSSWQLLWTPDTNSSEAAASGSWRVLGFSSPIPLSVSTNINILYNPVSNFKPGTIIPVSSTNAYSKTPWAALPTRWLEPASVSNIEYRLTQQSPSYPYLSVPEGVYVFNYKGPLAPVPSSSAATPASTVLITMLNIIGDNNLAVPNPTGTKLAIDNSSPLAQSSDSDGFLTSDGVWRSTSGSTTVCYTPAMPTNTATNPALPLAGQIGCTFMLRLKQRTYFTLGFAQPSGLMYSTNFSGGGPFASAIGISIYRIG
jgi:hypothetical protein